MQTFFYINNSRVDSFFFVVFDFQGNYICTIHGSYGNGKGLVRVYSQQFQRTIFLVGLTQVMDFRC